MTDFPLVASTALKPSQEVSSICRSIFDLAVSCGHWIWVRAKRAFIMTKTSR